MPTRKLLHNANLSAPLFVDTQSALPLQHELWRETTQVLPYLFEDELLLRESDRLREGKVWLCRLVYARYGLS